MEAQTQADASLQRTIKLLNDLMVLGDNIRHHPRMQLLSKRLFDDTLRMYDELEQEQVEHAATRRSRIIALIAAGDIYRNLIEFDKAETLLKKATDLLDVELNTSPHDLDLRYRETVIAWTLGVIYKAASRPQEALAAFQRDLVLHEAMLKQLPNNPNYLVSQSNILVNVCIVLRHFGRSTEALAKYEEAIAILREVLQRLPDHLMRTRSWAWRCTIIRARCVR